MQPILDTCQPRADILTGVFNPEIFTASLSQVMDCYRGRATPMHTLYSEAEQFFREATYPTEGLCMALAEVFGRPGYPSSGDSFWGWQNPYVDSPDASGLSRS